MIMKMKNEKRKTKQQPSMAFSVRQDQRSKSKEQRAKKMN